MSKPKTPKKYPITRLKLPAPRSIEEDFVYTPVVRAGSIVPWGYEQDPDDRQILLPIPEQLDLLEEAKEHLKQYSLRDVANWLHKESGRPISATGLRNRLNIEQKRHRKSLIYRTLAKQLEEALKKAKRIEDTYLSRRIPASEAGSDKYKSRFGDPEGPSEFEAGEDFSGESTEDSGGSDKG